MEAEKPNSQTGGLKLMTVFIVVLALHVVLIGGISAHHIFKRSMGDSAGDVSKQDSGAEGTEAAKLDTDVEALQANDAAPEASALEAQMKEIPPALPATGTAALPVSEIKPQAAATAAPVEIKTPATDNMAKATRSEISVSKGDSLYKIARQNHMTVDALKKLNGLSSDTLKIGQKLKVEDNGALPAPTTTAGLKPGSTAKPAPAAAATASTVYTVSKGDTLTKIAKQFNTTANAIMSANNLSDPRKLSIGAKLKIPGQQAAAQPAASEKAAKAAKPAPVESNELVMAR